MRLIVQARQRGDTIIEVMFAVVVFAFVSVLSFSIMNQGVAISQRALEVTQVRAQMDAQVNALRYIHQGYVDGHPEGVSQWQEIMDTKAKSAASQYSDMVDGVNCRTFSPGQNPFVMNARTAKLHSATPSLTPPSVSATLPPYPQVVYASDGVSITNAYGLWVEAVERPSVGGFVGYVDFHVRACWSTIGSSVPATLGTIVRLYEPAN